MAPDRVLVTLLVTRTARCGCNGQGTVVPGPLISTERFRVRPRAHPIRDGAPDRLGSSQVSATGTKPINEVSSVIGLRTFRVSQTGKRDSVIFVHKRAHRLPIARFINRPQFLSREAWSLLPCLGAAHASWRRCRHMPSQRVSRRPGSHWLGAARLSSPRTPSCPRGCSRHHPRGSGRACSPGNPRRVGQRPQRLPGRLSRPRPRRRRRRCVRCRRRGAGNRCSRRPRRVRRRPTPPAERAEIAEGRSWGQSSSPSSATSIW